MKTYFVTIGIYDKHWCISGTEDFEIECESDRDAIEEAKSIEEDMPYKNTMIDSIECEDGSEVKGYYD